MGLQKLWQDGYYTGVILQGGIDKFIAKGRRKLQNFKHIYFSACSLPTFTIHAQSSSQHMHTLFEVVVHIKKHLHLVMVKLSSHYQIAEVEYFELARKRDGCENRLSQFAVIPSHCGSVAAPNMILRNAVDFVCNFIMPQIKFAFGVYTALGCHNM